MRIASWGPVNDHYIRRYVDGIGYGQDVLIGAFEKRRLVGVVHAAKYLENEELLVYVGVSVDVDARRHGLGKRLLLAVLGTSIAKSRQWQRS